MGGCVVPSSKPVGPLNRQSILRNSSPIRQGPGLSPPQIPMENPTLANPIMISETPPHMLSSMAPGIPMPLNHSLVPMDPMNTFGAASIVASPMMAPFPGSTIVHPRPLSRGPSYINETSTRISTVNMHPQMIVSNPRGSSLEKKTTIVEQLHSVRPGVSPLSTPPSARGYSPGGAMRTSFVRQTTTLTQPPRMQIHDSMVPSMNSHTVNNSNLFQPGHSNAGDRSNYLMNDNPHQMTRNNSNSYSSVQPQQSMPQMQQQMPPMQQQMPPMQQQPPRMQPPVQQQIQPPIQPQNQHQMPPMQNNTQRPTYTPNTMNPVDKSMLNMDPMMFGAPQTSPQLYTFSYGLEMPIMGEKNQRARAF